MAGRPARQRKRAPKPPAPPLLDCDKSTPKRVPSQEKNILFRINYFANPRKSRPFFSLPIPFRIRPPNSRIRPMRRFGQPSPHPGPLPGGERESCGADRALPSSPPACPGSQSGACGRGPGEGVLISADPMRERETDASTAKRIGSRREGVAMAAVAVLPDQHFRRGLPATPSLPPQPLRGLQERGALRGHVVLGGAPLETPHHAGATGNEKGRRNLRRPHFSTVTNLPQNASRVKEKMLVQDNKSTKPPKSRPFFSLPIPLRIRPPNSRIRPMRRFGYPPHPGPLPAGERESRGAGPSLPSPLPLAPDRGPGQAGGAGGGRAGDEEGAPVAGAPISRL